MQKTVEPYVIQLLESKDLSKTYGARADQEEINKKVAEITEKAAEILVDKLEKQQMLDKKEASQKEIQKLFEESVKEALAIFNGLKNDSK